MKIKVTQVLKDYEDKPILQNGKPLTFRDMVSTALNAVQLREEKDLTPEDKNMAFQLSIKLWASEEVDFSIEELAFAKKRCEAVLLSPLVLGRVCEIFKEKNKS